MDLFEELTQLIAAFDAGGVDYAVCGAGSSKMATPTPDQVTARLRRIAELSRDVVARPAVDYSPTGVTERLREVAELSELCARLGEIGRAARRR